MGHGRTPGVKHCGDADASAQVLGIGRDGDHGLGRGREQDVVDRGLVLIGDVGDALDIAMNYLDLTGQAVMYEEVRSTAAMAITAAWKVGVRHRIRLAHIAIKVVDINRNHFLKYQERG
jgi:hypothetical protein